MILSSIFFAIVISFIRSISIFVSSKLLLTRVMKNARVIYTRFANSRAETISWRESPTRTTTWRLAVAFVFCLWSFIFFFFFYSCTSFACSLSKRSDCFEVAANLAGRPCYGATHERDTSLRSAPRQKWQGPSNYNGWRKKKRRLVYSAQFFLLSSNIYTRERVTRRATLPVELFSMALFLIKLFARSPRFW